MSQLTSSHEFYDKFLSKVIGNLPPQIVRMRIDLDFSSMAPVIIDMQILGSLSLDDNGDLKIQNERFNLVPIDNNEGEVSK